MFASKLRLQALTLAARLLALRIVLCGQAAMLREAAYRALMRYQFRTGLIAYAFDPDDEDTKAAIAAAVEEALAPLKTKNRDLLTKLNKAKQGDSIDPVDLEKLEGELDSLKAQLADANKQLKTANTNAEKAAQALAAEQAHTQRLLINDGLTQALTAAGVKDPMHLKAAAALLRDEYKPAVTADGENRVAMVGDKPLAEFVKTWAQGDEGKSFVSAQQNGGGGAQGGKAGGGVVNPWNPATKNVTQQGQMFLQNPELARSMAAEFGESIPQ